MVARRNKSVTVSLKTVRAAKSRPVRRVEFSGSVHDAAQLLCDLGLEVPDAEAQSKYGMKNVLVFKGKTAKGMPKQWHNVTPTELRGECKSTSVHRFVVKLTKAKEA